MKLAGKTAIITGGAMGIGRVLAEGLAAEGANIIIADRAGAAEAAAEMAAAGHSARAVACDVSSEQETESMAGECIEAFGAIDVLVNNAGIYSSLTPQPFEAQSAEEWRNILDVNVIGTFLCCKAVVAQMRTQGGGRIINLSSGTPFKGVPYLLHYVASKGAINAITKSLAKELGSDGILVNGIAPGFTLSDGVMANPVQLEKLKDISLQARTLQRDQLPSDLVGAAVYFASADSAFVTGQTLVVDGGAYFH
ncbi:MAG: SDR family oxidoreductase [Rhodospirillaceae bacterium]|nr:SDR family oxidoreductase [Rhodospirillaceae bacterium]MBT3927206.1 SDR family oxidoreductase [Rhodospirillaceae bacterium]MBT4425312.1 SDR family oxidoreductase [Rhodospirillaceae bacterium]MBT5675036.1 SDR family oxidoreductase [Rhodospirillaceae bacterium]MBT5778546.1 SDR family oxidoreductase [Rhodospirillaceae bacterium]